MLKTAGKISTFEMILFGVFGFVAVVGLIVFGTFKSFSNDVNNIGSVEIWGTLPSKAMNNILLDFTKEDRQYEDVVYVEKDERTFRDDLLNALASGEGPDLVVLREDWLLENQSRLFVIPFENFSERDFSDSFVEAGEVFMSSEGIYGFPIAVDPLVLYWNRSIFSSSGIARPPQYWDEMRNVVAPAITRRDAAFEIQRSAIGMGEYVNVKNAKEIMAMLLLQTGNPIVKRTSQGWQPTIADSNSPMSESALQFYTDFANPARDVYTWNRALPNDDEAFLAGDLGMYLGFATELDSLRERNPNLNFDVVSVPQGRDISERVAFAHVYALSIPKAADNKQGAFLVAQQFSSLEGTTRVSQELNVAPVRRDGIASATLDRFAAAFYDSALIARTWLDPDPEATGKIFMEMIESVTSGRSSLSGSLNDAHTVLQQMSR